jgi:hypothetical protein
MSAPDPHTPGSFNLPFPKSPSGRAIEILSGFGLATILLLLLGLLTWFATLEQIDHGLYPTLRKYFDWRSLFLVPEINGKTVPLPLPGGYWVSALLFVNLLLGGVIRIRKGWKHAGNLISHIGILLMLAGGGVAHHFSERGNMAIHEGAVNDAAEDYFEYVVEIAEIIEGKPSFIRVIRGREIEDLTEGQSRTFRMPDLPFDIKLAGYHVNARPVSMHERAPAQNEPEVDGYYLMSLPGEVNAESNTAACYARTLFRDGTQDLNFILAGASFHPFTVRHGDRTFTVDMRKRIWPMPFAVSLDKFTADFHPGTMKPSKFISEITRKEAAGDAKVTIQMNEPMRYRGLTFFQASYGPPGAGPGQKMYSVFEIVKNPADQWPEYSIYIVSLGMLITFLTRFGSYVASQSRKHHHG